MGSSEKFCLRWNDFESNISTAFRELREDKDFFDVTLVCDEDQIQTHKVILSACSPFFRSVLRRNRHEHPLLYMKGIKYADIVSVLNFMYHGEVNVGQEELNSFLAVAEDLKVKGLTQNGSENSSQISHAFKHQTTKTEAKDSPEEKTVCPPPKSKHPRALQIPIPSFQPKHHHNARYHDDVDEIQEVTPIKSEPGSMHAPQDRPGTILGMETENADNTLNTGEGVLADPNTNSTIYDDEYAEYSNYEADQSYDEGAMAHQSMPATLEGTQGCIESNRKSLESFLIPTVLENGMSGWQCPQCDKQTNHKGHMKDHIEGVHYKMNYPCDICGSVLGSLSAIKKHIARTHK